MQAHEKPKNASVRGMQTRFPLPRLLKAPRKLATPCQYLWEPPASLHSSLKPLARQPASLHSSLRAKSGLPTSSRISFGALFPDNAKKDATQGLKSYI